MFKKKALFLITLITITIFSIIIITKTPKVYADLLVNASFTTQNTAPTGAIELRIQDFPGSFDACDVADQGDPVNFTDTHWRAGYGPDQGPNLTWNEGTDAEDPPSAVKTLVCIASTAALRDAATELNAATNCDIFNRFTTATAIEPNSVILNPANLAQNFNSTVFLDNRTVHVKLRAVDSPLLLSNPYTCNITIINAVPDSNSTGFRTQDAFNPNDANTHHPIPIVNWTDSSDKDDGLTIDHYPADDLDYILFIGDATPGDAQRINKPYLGIKGSQLNSSEALQSEWDQPLTLTNPTSSLNGYMNQTYYYRIITSDQFLHSTNGSGADGNFQFWDFLPQVRTIAIHQISLGAIQYCDKASGCTIDPLTHSNVTGLNFNVTLYDLDNDVCANETYSGTVRLCLNNTALSPSPITCNNALANFTFRLDMASPAGIPNHCNLSMSQYQGPQPTTLALGATPPFFFQPSRMYKILANISSNTTFGGHTLTVANDINATQNWTYNTKIASTFLNESAGETQTTYIGGAPPPAAFSQSSGTINYNMTNWANAEFALTWNTSAFHNSLFPLPGGCTTIPGGVWTPDTTQFFRVDDDGGLGAYNTEPGIPAPQGGTGNLQPLSLSATQQTYVFSGGIRRCRSYGCNTVSFIEGLNTFQTNETLMHWWHIYPPSGLCTGTWIANLTFVATPNPGQ